MGTAIKNLVPDQVRLSCVIFDTRSLSRTGLSRSECPGVKNYKWLHNRVWHRMLITVPRPMATVGVKGLNLHEVGLLAKSRPYAKINRPTFRLTSRPAVRETWWSVLVWTRPIAVIIVKWNCTGHCRQLCRKLGRQRRFDQDRCNVIE